MATSPWRLAFRIFAGVSAAGIIGALGVMGFAVFKYVTWSNDLPDHTTLKEYAPPVTTRIHAGDGELIAEYARERRLFVPYEGIPDLIIKAFISAEDKNFFTHQGVDFKGVVRATLSNIDNYLNDRRLEGASTITQQVAKNFLLSSEKSLERKAKEWILATRIENSLTKEQIMELYLNEIYLGLSSYGVAAAALNYFDKSLNELTLADVAYLAALPKAPNNYHPLRRKERAIIRRDWVLDRMLANGFITEAQAQQAKAEDLIVQPRRIGIQTAEAGYFAEEVRRQIVGIYGDEALYNGGLSVRTTLEPELQQLAMVALRDGLTSYDRRHGWRGPLKRVPKETLSLETLEEVFDPLRLPNDVEPWTVAVVLEVVKSRARIAFEDGRTGRVPLEELTWARQYEDENTLGPEIQAAWDVLAPGDIIYVEPLDPAKTEDGASYGLRQIPAVNGAIAALDPHSGRVLALVGGFSFDMSEFNRATQASRQPGSAFKPFVYAAALDTGMTPSTLILDAPFVIDQGPGQGLWKPDNYSDRFYGPSTLRLGIERSRNVMTVRLAQEIGMAKVVDYARKFGINEDMLPVLSMSLGAGETTLLDLTAAYGMLVNGGKKLEPILIDRIQDQRGRTIYRNDQRECIACAAEGWDGQAEPRLADSREQLIDERTAFQVVSMLEGVVQRGTASKLGKKGLTLAGKTGTTNEERDAWFVGFGPDLAVGVYVGFDNPQPMGKSETGGKLAAPIFGEFMAAALEGSPTVPFRTPSGIRLLKVNHTTGLPQTSGSRTITEAFKAGNEPKQRTANVIGGSSVLITGSQGPGGTSTIELGSGTGGLY